MKTTMNWPGGLISGTSFLPFKTILCGRYIMEGVPVSQVRHSYNGKHVFYNKKFMKKKKRTIQQLNTQRRIERYSTTDGFFENGKIPVGVPVKISLLYIFPRPQRLKRKKDLAGFIPHVSKPDIDNLDKFYLDCLTGIAFDDDNQVFNIESIKFYSSWNFKTKEEGWIGAIAHILTPIEKEFCIKKELNPDGLPW